MQAMKKAKGTLYQRILRSVEVQSSLYLSITEKQETTKEAVIFASTSTGES